MNDTSEIDLTPAQSIPLAVYCFFVTFFGLTGNGLVLYSSLRYDAIKLDEVSLEFVRNLALADILYTICIVLPQFVTFAARRWVLGPVYCVLQGEIGMVPGSLNTLTVFAISAYRLKLVISPFHQISLRTARILIGVIWLLALSPLVLIESYHLGVHFDPSIARCMGDIYDHDEARGPFMILVGIIVFIPLFGIIGINFGLLGVALRLQSSRNNGSSHGINFKALLVTLALSGLFMFSWGPYLAYTFIKIKTPVVSQHFTLVVFNFLLLNVFGNPFLYTMTNRRFSRYVHSLLCGFDSRGQVQSSRMGDNKTAESNL